MARPYRSVAREAHAEATRTAILRAFADQLGRPGATDLSPTAAAAAAGVSLRSVHAHFPDLTSRLAGVAAHVDEELGPPPPIEGVDDLPEHVRRVHRRAAEHLPLARALATASRADTARARRTRGRHLDIAALLTGIGAPTEPTRRAIAAVCMLAELDALVPMVDVHGLEPDEAAEAAAHAVAAIVADLRARRDAKLSA